MEPSPELALTISVLPSPLRSAAATPRGKPMADNVLVVPKAPLLLSVIPIFWSA